MSESKLAVRSVTRSNAARMAPAKMLLVPKPLPWGAVDHVWSSNPAWYFLCSWALNGSLDGSVTMSRRQKQALRRAPKEERAIKRTLYYNQELSNSLVKKKDPGCISATKVPFIWKKLVPSRRVIRLPEIQLYPGRANFSCILLQNKKLARLEDWTSRVTLLWWQGHPPSWAIFSPYKYCGSPSRVNSVKRDNQSMRKRCWLEQRGKRYLQINACSGRLTLWSGTGFLHMNLA